VQALFLTSISIPALGTGALKFPEGIVAKVLLEEAIKFSSNHSCSLEIKECNIVVYHDNKKAVDDFKKHFQDYLKPKNDANFHNTGYKMEDLIPATNNGTQQTTVEIVQGDIVKETTNAIGFLVQEDITQGMPRNTRT
jgi:hypothetical protein